MALKGPVSPRSTDILLATGIAFQNMFWRGMSRAYLSRGQSSSQRISSCLMLHPSSKHISLCNWCAPGGVSGKEHKHSSLLNQHTCNFTAACSCHSDGNVCVGFSMQFGNSSKMGWSCFWVPKIKSQAYENESLWLNEICGQKVCLLRKLKLDASFKQNERGVNEWKNEWLSLLKIFIIGGNYNF